MTYGFSPAALPVGIRGRPLRRRRCLCLVLPTRSRTSNSPSLMSRRTHSGRACGVASCASISHAPFQGFNRAQAAILEAAILVSRLHMLPRDRIERELAYLRSAVEKTAGLREVEAWSWLTERSRCILPAGTSPTLQKPIRGDSPRAGPILAYLNSKNLPAQIARKTARRDAPFNPCPWALDADCHDSDLLGCKYT